MDTAIDGYESGTAFRTTDIREPHEESYEWHTFPSSRNFSLEQELRPLLIAAHPIEDIAWFWTQTTIAFFTGFLAALTETRSTRTVRLSVYKRARNARANERIFTTVAASLHVLLNKQIYPDITRPMVARYQQQDPMYGVTYDRLWRFSHFIAGISPAQFDTVPAGVLRIINWSARLGTFIYGIRLAEVYEQIRTNIIGGRYGAIRGSRAEDVRKLIIVATRGQEFPRSQASQGLITVRRYNQERQRVEDYPIATKRQHQMIQGGVWNTRAWFTARFVTHGLPNPRLEAYRGKFHIMQSPNCLLNALVCNCTGKEPTCSCTDLAGKVKALKERLGLMEIVENIPLIVRGWREVMKPEACSVQVFYFNNFNKETEGAYVYKEAWETTKELRLIIVYGGRGGPHNAAHCMLFHAMPGDFPNPIDVTNFMLMSLKRGPTMAVLCCPCCDAPVENTSGLMSHVVRFHGLEGVCPQCGFRFANEEDLASHIMHFCPITNGALIREISPEVEGYKERTTKYDYIVYADTESCIDADGVHHSCLFGYVALTGAGKLVQGYYSFATATEFMRSLNQLGGATATKIAVYLHNGTGYDFHFIIPELCRMEKTRGFNSVWETGERVKYFTVSFDRKQITFKDTFDFMATSLAKWIEDCKKGGCGFEIFRECLAQLKPRQTEEDIEVLLRKNPFPYKKLRKPTDLLQGIGWFLSATLDEWGKADMTTEKAADAMRHIQDVFCRFKLRSVKDYLDLYLLCDVTMLADCMQEFVKRTQEQIGLDPHLFYGSPSLSWNAWLSQLKFKLEPIPDAKMYDLVKASIRGGQVQASQRYYNAQDEPRTLAIDLDCNSLYPTVMVNFSFPVHSWHYEEALTVERIRELEESGESGFVLVDLELHSNPACPAVDDWPFIAERRDFVVPVVEGSALELYQATREGASQHFSGLLQHLGAFDYYACSSKNLLWYIDHGAILKKIYYGYFGKCEPVFKEYVGRNLELRDKFKKEPTLKALYKLLSNSLYGKTYEDVEKRTQVTTYELEQGKPAGYVRDVLTEDKWGFAETVPDKVVLNKPIYLGACITEWSKLWMYQFFYDKVIPMFPTARIMYTDTDAITVKFPWEGELQALINTLNSGEQLIDTSNFTMEGFVNTDNNGKAGLFKSETTTPIIEMVALRAKTYIMHCSDGSFKSSMKGVPFAARAQATMDEFKRVLFNPGEILEVEFDAITSKGQEVKSERLEKIALSADDLKRDICCDLIHTKPRIL